jgi:putative two-component system response regulator
MSPTILIVEDDEVARLGLSYLLQADGYDTVTASNGHEAMERLHAAPRPDLVLLDMILPESDGWVFCGRRRNDADAALVPVVIMTGLGVADEPWAKALGAVGLLPKPLDVPELLRTVAKHTHRRANEATYPFPG